MEICKTDLARDLIRKYLDIAERTKKQFSKRYLGTVLFNENPDLFKDEEDGRKFIRMALNAVGPTMIYDKNKELAQAFSLLPQAISDTVTTEPYVFPVSIKSTLWIADLHSLFYNRKALEMAISYAIKRNCDSVTVLGDLFDFYRFSKFSKNPLTITKCLEEREWGQDFLKLLQDTFGFVVVKQGNHDAHRERKLFELGEKMPELAEYASFSDYCFFDGCKVNFIEDYRHLKYGKLNGIHGHEYYGGGGIHVAYNRFNKALDNLISAHSHIAGSVIKKDINDNVYGSWTIGCMCGLSPRYATKNAWTNGFAVTEKDESGEFEVDNRIILGNKTVNA